MGDDYMRRLPAPAEVLAMSWGSSGEEIVDMSSPQFTLREALRFDPGYQTTFEDKLFYDGLQWARRLINFVALLTLATFIATFGVIGDSTATIIGAMIVAPL